MEGKTSEPGTILTEEEETSLVNWLFLIAACSFPGTKDQLCKNFQRPNSFLKSRPGRSWFDWFIKRHPGISEKSSENHTLSGARLSKDVIQNCSIEIKNYLRSENWLEITSDPDRVFKLDESGFMLNTKGERVLVKKGDKTVYLFINSDEKECLTALIACSGHGCLFL